VLNVRRLSADPVSPPDSVEPASLDAPPPAASLVETAAVATGSDW
jgi:hypothetical protein